MSRRRIIGRLNVFSAVGASVVYVVFASFAYLSYPGAYGPFNNNWLSDLGNRTANPQGAIFYAVGCVVTGLLVIGFFASLVVWRSGAPKVQKYVLMLTQLAGIAGGLAVIMSAIYSIDRFEAHQFWSRLICASLAIALFAAPFALHRRGMRLMPLILVSALGYCSIVVRLVFPAAHWLEWPSIGLLFAFMWVAAYATQGISRPPSRHSGLSLATSAGRPTRVTQ